MIRRILREPLVHFLLIVAVLFALYRITGSGTAEPAQRIVIGTGEVERLALTFSRLWMRPPTAEELRGLIDKEIRSSFFPRPGLRAGSRDWYGTYPLAPSSRRSPSSCAAF